MDSLLLIGAHDSKLAALLGKLGYSVHTDRDGSSIAETLSSGVVDLVIIDSQLDGGGIDLCEYLRSDEASKSTPILYVAHDREQRYELEKHHYENTSCVDAGASIGVLAGKIATELRMRKMRGGEGGGGTMAEVNAALRDHNLRLSKERAEARAIQESLMPRQLPADERYEIAATWWPLDEVGGDWYYVEPGGDGSVWLHIADVTGHGLAAALVGSMTKLAIAASACDDPARLYGSVNRLLTPQLPEGRFVTMSSLRYDPAAGSLTAVRAGHPPPLLIRRGGRGVERMGVDGYPIGFIEDAGFGTTSAVLEPGDTALLYTDGLPEAQSRSGEMFGIERIGAALAKGAGDLSAAGQVERLYAEFDRFIGGRLLRDDVTVVLLRRTR